MPVEEEDTEQVEELLETMERTIIAATQKLSLGRPSRPPTPQTGLVFGQTRPTTALPGSFPMTKGKRQAPSTGIIAGPLFSAPDLSAPPIQTSSMPPSSALPVAVAYFPRPMI